jgi:uncharacterized membrane protein
MAGIMSTESLASVTRENVAAITHLEQHIGSAMTGTDRFADRVRRFCASAGFLVFHVIWFAAWIAWNAVPGTWHFDPYPFTFLTLTVSLEAIFLSAFVLISQEHSSRLDAQRNRLDLQINLLTEQENTKMLLMLERIAAAVGVPTQSDEMLQAFEQTMKPEELARQIAAATADEAEST